MSDIRVLIAEDQTLMRQGLRTILDKLHAANRTHATKIARTRGLIE